MGANKPDHRRGRTSYQFALRLVGVEDIDGGLEEAVHRAGCDDAALYLSRNRIFLEFDRDAETLNSAVVGAIRAVENCGLGIKVGEVTSDAHDIRAINAALKPRDGDDMLELSG